MLSSFPRHLAEERPSLGPEYPNLLDQLLKELGCDLVVDVHAVTRPTGTCRGDPLARMTGVRSARSSPKKVRRRFS